MRKMEEQYGVEYRRWPDETLRQFEEAWEEVVEERSASDAGFKKIADSYFEFRRSYRIWGEAQAMKVTYLDDEEPAAPSTTLFPLFMAKDDTRGLQGFARSRTFPTSRGRSPSTRRTMPGCPAARSCFRSMRCRRGTSTPSTSRMATAARASPGVP